MLVDKINHDMPIYKGCSLNEIMMLGIFILSFCLLTFPLMTKVLFGHFLIGVVISLFSSFFLTQLAVLFLAHLKRHRPYGYYRQLIRLKLEEQGFYRSPYVRRRGRWTIGG